MTLVEINSDTVRPSIPDPWLTPREAAERARLCIDNFLLRCRKGIGPRCVGRRRLMRFRASEIDAWVAAGFTNA
jgi:hypothetical protein